MCDAGPMAQTVCVIVSAADRERLQAIIGDRNQPRKHIERARLVLASAEREPAQRVAAGVGVSRPTVWRWQQRYAEVGVEGLLRDDCRANYGTGGGADLHHSAPPGDPLDRPGYGQGSHSKSRKDSTHFCHIWPIKKDIRYTIRLQIDQDHGVTQRACRLAHLADGLFSGV